jgi:hypothetical protein
MKVTLDLARLVEDGRLTPEEAERLKGLAAEGTGSLAINILVGFGVVAVAGGILGLFPVPSVAGVIGSMVGMVGLGMILTGQRSWAVFANICLLSGALILAGGIIALTKGTPLTFFGITLLFSATAILARSGLLMALAVIALSAALGASTTYWHATYSLGIQQPLLTIVLFSALALGLYHLSKRLKADLERLAIIAARTALLLINLGFWIGSLWGDRLRFLGPDAGFGIPAWIFSILWVVAIVGAGSWAARANRPWVLNLAAVFGAIHFYTQWFERLGATPLSVLVAGVVTLGSAVALWKYNQGKTIPA